MPNHSGFVNSPNMPNTVFTMVNGMAQQVPLSQLPNSAQRPSPSNNAPASRGSPMLQQHTFAHSPLQRNQTSSVTNNSTPGVVPSNMHIQSGPASYQQWRGIPNAAPISPATAQQQMQQMQQQPQPAQPPQTHIRYAFNVQDLLHRIHGQLSFYEQQDPTGRRFRAETGRLCLLRDAVDNNDWFYIVLSQLSCLRSTSPTSLPQSMNRIGADSYAQLDALICANSSLQDDLVRWFADFPRPIMQIYSGGQGQGRAYEMQVHAVLSFLINLPRHWQGLVAESRKREAPPLVQDMTERLWLFSPVLQTTAFRAIARTFWGSVPEVESGIEALVNVHHMDQQTYNPLTKRDPVAKQRAYEGFKAIFREWQRHDQRLKQFMVTQVNQNVPTNSLQHQPVFQMPAQALAPFGFTVVPSTPVSAPVQQQLQQNARVIAPVNQMQTQVQNRQAFTSAHPPRYSTSTTSVVPSSPNVIQQPQTANRAYQPTPLQQPMPRGKRLLFPAENQCPRAQPTHPDTTRAALHQAHVRSPTLGHAELEPSAPKLYRQVGKCVLSPKPIDQNKPIQKIPFEIGPMHKAARTRRPPDRPGQSVRLMEEGSVALRLRCSRVDQRRGFPDLSSWVTSDCYWPETMYFDINGQELEPRKKLQHGRYQPIDVTDYVHQGQNELRVFVNRGSKDPIPFDYAVAVELVETVSHENIISGLTPISATDSLAAIKASLSGPSDDDDDIVMTSSSMTIVLFDPMSGCKIFDTPVRGKDCLHRDAFDLETFLSTRRRQQAGYPSVVDDWRCPICRGDVRPHVLVKDEFLMQIRDNLELLGQLETREIMVNADGSWSAKVEERTGVRSASLEREERAASAFMKGSKKPPPEIIELD